MKPESAIMASANDEFSERETGHREYLWRGHQGVGGWASLRNQLKLKAVASPPRSYPLMKKA
jgi:hypothetical protein